MCRGVIVTRILNGNEKVVAEQSEAPKVAIFIAPMVAK